MAETTTTNLKHLLNALDSKNDRTRADAIRQVRGLSPDALLTLSGLEAQHFRKYLGSQRDQAVLIQVTTVSLVVSVVYLAVGTYCLLPAIMYLIIHVFILPRITVHVSGGFQPSRARRNLTVALEEVTDVSVVPVALTLLQDRTPDITPAVIAFLKRLLPQLHAGDAQTWTPEQYQSLLKLLSAPPKDKKLKDTELALSVLKALEQIGDARAIPTVEVLAYSSPHSVPPQVQQATVECLPYLRQRAGEQRQAQTLLRPTQPSTTGENLLRPAAQTTPQTPDEQLLRPQQH